MVECGGGRGYHLGCHEIAVVSWIFEGGLWQP